MVLQEPRTTWYNPRERADDGALLNRLDIDVVPSVDLLPGDVGFGVAKTFRELHPIRRCPQYGVRLRGPTLARELKKGPSALPTRWRMPGASALGEGPSMPNYKCESALVLNAISNSLSLSAPLALTTRAHVPITLPAPRTRKGLILRSLATIGIGRIPAAIPYALVLRCVLISDTIQLQYKAQKPLCPDYVRLALSAQFGAPQPGCNAAIVDVIFYCGLLHSVWFSGQTSVGVDNSLYVDLRPACHHAVQRTRESTQAWTWTPRDHVQTTAQGISSTRPWTRCNFIWTLRISLAARARRRQLPGRNNAGISPWESATMGTGRDNGWEWKREREPGRRV
ncbi:uncharacterized protein B0H18DRAFT_954757 [Fomitopsis serialis]|uniref:uncharacterized protein n=1 Tax=Fomitopsis serialis TaxID=139415 RepID=UPI002008A4BB|nr:uncharacterized protein B0H18DRAFT_954757 [Neoantrodia serialis]KAH9926474.1 hypothetical protein B0H18DRAFT_954757 [Neoantrodia serialis]